MSNILTYVLIFTLPLIHSSFLNYFGFNFNSLVYGNFEFTKVIFFNLLSSLIIFSFFIESLIKKEKIKIYYAAILSLIIIVSSISIIFSISPFISFFGNQEKNHSFILILNLIGIFVVLTNKKKEVLNKYLKVIIISFIITFLIGIKELLYPALNYLNEPKYAVSTYGSNHFFALSVILLLPILYKKIKGYYLYLLLILLFFIVFLTKSFLAISIFIIYIVIKTFGKKQGLIISFFLISIGLIIIFNYFPEKIHSLLSRFYIWENVISLYISSFKNIIFGYGFESLEIMFPKEKNAYLYIFENFGYFADRSHNLWIDILFSTGILGFSLSVYVSFLILKITKNTYYYDTFMLFFIFVFFNFASITNYLFFIILFVIFNINKEKDNFISIKVNYYYLVFVFFFIFSFICEFKFYIAETYYKKGSLERASIIFPYPKYLIENGDNKGLDYYSFKPIYYYINNINKNEENILNNCISLVNNYAIAESYIYCGRILEKNNYKKESLEFYEKGLSKLPDLRNNKSDFYSNYLIKKTISKNRFFSEKYGYLEEIVKKVGY
ncbi:hypothetical protein EOM39_02910 [Candidatus Gracilibacteria bacterium]|nr:hypothetical protein [Candidatus Gracilibacteria bacterium]